MTFSGDGSLGELLESLQTLEPEPWPLAASAPAAPLAAQELRAAGVAAGEPPSNAPPAQPREIAVNRVDRVATGAMDDSRAVEQWLALSRGFKSAHEEDGRPPNHEE
jgi:hypothetical protein